jgi:hypothetical protein
MLRSGNAPLHVELVTPAGTVQADATAIPTNASPALVVSAGTGAAGIRLPKAVKGKAYFIKNTGGSALLVYPAVGDGINAILADSALSMAALTSAVIVAKDSTTWYTIPLLPS